MWFEILPPAVIIYVAFNAAGILTYVAHKTFLGNPYRRDLRWQPNWRTYLRDRKLTNNPYKFNGLEKIYCPCMDDAEENEPDKNQ